MQVLELQNTFTGPVTVNQGILSMFYPNTNYNTAGMVKVAAGATYGIQSAHWSATQISNLLATTGDFAVGSFLGLDATAAWGSGTSSDVFNLPTGVGLNVFGGSAGTSVVLYNNNSYTGGTNVLGPSILRAEAATPLGTGGVNLSAGTLALDVPAGGGGNNVSIGPLSGVATSGLTIYVESATNTGLTLTTTTTGTATFAGYIYNGTTGSDKATLSIIKAGTGTQIFSNLANSYTGTTTVNNGTLEIAGTGTVPLYATSGKLSVAAGATLAVEVGGTGQWQSVNIDNLLTNTSAFSTGSFLGIDTTGGSFVYSTVIGDGTHGPAAMGLVKLGTNSLTLSGNNSYTSGTSVTGGTLQLGNAGALGAGSVALSAGVLDLASNSTTIGALSGTAGSTITNTTGSPVTLTTNFASGVSAFAGLLSNGTGTTTLTKSGNGGVLNLSGVNTYTGGTNIGGGTVQLGNSSALGTGPVNIYSPGVLDLAGLSFSTTP